MERKRRRESGGASSCVGEHEEALEVSAMNFNACNGNSNISCQDMYMNGSQGQQRGVHGGVKGAWHL